MAEITPEQRAVLRSSLIPFVTWGQGTVLADLDAAIDGLIALGWRAPGPATEEEVESAARAMAANDLWHRWQGYASMARAALNAALNPAREGL